MKKLILFCFSVIISFPVFSQTSRTGWVSGSESQKRFIENKSQFDEMVNPSHSKIMYGVDWGKTKICFSAQGLTYRFDDPIKNKKREEGSPEPKFFPNSDLVYLQWEGASPDVQVIAGEQTSDYFSYAVNKNENINHIKGYKKLIYKNLYPNIDALYEFHETDGIKYSLILRPGADVAQIKMKYESVDNISIDKNGNTHLPTKFGDIIDHTPLTFYSGNKNSIIQSKFVKTGNTISFSLGNYDKTKTIVIDPWTQTPTLPNSNGVWECEVDAAGNVYIIGGCMPMKLLKYNSAGAIQWTYVTPWDTANAWLGTLATDLTGNSYVTSGSIAAMQKVNTSAGMVWNYTAPAFSVDEYWTISFNCDQTMLVVGGTTGPGFPSTNLEGAIFNINTTNGNIIGTPQIVGIMFNNFPPYINEVRTLSASKNARYYYLTLDTIGCIDQNFVCTTSGPIFATNSGYNLSYKCENFRPNNGNGGIKAIRANGNFVYTQNGTNVQKRSLATGAIITTVAIPGGVSTASLGKNSLGNSGLDIDSCGNVYVGSANQVVKYDANLNFISSTATSYVVSDVAVSYGGNIISCGTTGTSASTSRTGYVQSASMANCDPMTLVCCNANICPPDPFCSTDPAQTLTASSPGGTWSGTGITNTSTGLFDPSVSGTGTFTITYTLACGSGSMTVVVNNCAIPTVCLEANGDLTVSGGAGPAYQWQVWTPASSSAITTQAQCTACNPSYTWFFGTCLNGAMPVDSCTTPAGWTTYSTSATAAPPGTWPIQVIDGSGNILVINSLTGIPSCSGVVNVSTVHTNVLCNGQCNGTATVTASGGTSPYTYAWSNAQSTSAITGLCAGTYTVLVSDAAAITNTATVIITQPATALTSTATVTSGSCGSGGSASVNTSGGTSAYTYSWTGGCTTSSCTGLAAGNYTATVTDANGCTTTSTVSIISASGGTVTITSQTNVLCNGDSTGSATALMNGGTSPYTYLWNPSAAATATATGLSAGSYTILVTDASGCTTTQSVSITQPTAITSSVTSTNTTCGASTGTAQVSASGGTGSLTYNWNPGGQTTPNISNLGVGNYTCTITDANGCTQIQTANVTNANGPVATTSVVSTVTCNGGNNGSANSSATGGTTPYTYLWNTSPPQTTVNATGLSAGTYTITVTDATGCTNTQTVVITQPAAMTASITTTQASCGLSDGSATVNPNAGSLPYTYMWSNFQSTQTISGISAGTYSVIVTDASGCSQTFTTIVTVSNGPTAVAGTSATITSGSSANLTASGGVTYSWAPATGLSNPNIANPVASPGQTTEYCVYVFDATGCSDSACVTIYVDAPCSAFYFPNAFSPNDDNENDVLRVYPPDIARCISEYKLVVFDRWGEKLFESIDPAETWDGKRKGKTMDTQVLAYYLHVIFIDGTTIDKQGNVSLVR